MVTFFLQFANAEAPPGMETLHMHESGPLVSVIIRSLGRPSLARSVTSVAAQRHRPLEIVVVNAGASSI